MPTPRFLLRALQSNALNKNLGVGMLYNIRAF
jgi:hypothetical protein